jgi:hypothetical protein
VLGLIPDDRHTVSATIGIAVTPMSAEGSVDAARSPLSAMMEASERLDAATNRWEIYTTYQQGGSPQAALLVFLRAARTTSWMEGPRLRPTMN